jgi:hypothetical protein
MRFKGDVLGLTFGFLLSKATWALINLFVTRTSPD